MWKPLLEEHTLGQGDAAAEAVLEKTDSWSNKSFLVMHVHVHLGHQILNVLSTMWEDGINMSLINEKLEITFIIELKNLAMFS